MSENTSETQYIKSNIGQMTDHVINVIIDECRKQHNRDKVYNGVVEPLVNEVTQKLYPYIITVSLLYMLVLSLIIIILYMMIKKNKN